MASQPAQTFDELLLQLDINQQGLDESVLLIKSDKGAQGELLASQEDFQRWRLHVPQENPLNYKGKNFYPLHAIAGLSYILDETQLTVAMTVPAQAFVATSFDESSTRIRASRPDLGGFVNYDLFVERTDRQTQRSGLFELGLFNRFGVGTSHILAQNLSAGLQANPTHFIRLESTWTFDRPEQLASLRIGDTINQSGMWGRSVRFGGIQYATNFATQPGLVTIPLQSVVGQAVLPSTVDLYVNNVLTANKEVSPGPFAINNIPVVTGLGSVRMVVRDVLGREQIVTQPFYASASLLAKGLQSFSYEMGSVRRNFGLTSDDYGQWLMSGTHRQGFSDHWTGETHFELQAGQVSLGTGNTFLVPSLGVFTASLAASHRGSNTVGSGAAGHLWELGFERQTNSWSMSAHTQGASKDFSQIGLEDGQSAPKRLTSFNIGSGSAAYGSFGVGYVFQDNRDDHPVRLLSANYSLGLGRFGFVSVSAVKSLGGNADNFVGLNWTFSLGEGTTAIASLTRQHDPQEMLAQVQRSAPAGTGIGYLLQASDHNTQRASVTMQNNVGTYNVDVAATPEQINTRLGVSGGIALLGGQAHLSRRISDSFAVVSVPGYPSVRVYADNQLVNVTNNQGNALLPKLRPYEQNLISIEQADLPLDAKVGVLGMNAIPYFRSGMLVKFPVERSNGALLSIKLDSGQPVPAGATVTLNGKNDVFPVGHDGEVYLTGLADLNAIHVVWHGQDCNFTVSFPHTDDPLPSLGTFICKGVRP